ncbi:MAG: RDD family protein [Flavobacteriales bacterium]
MKTIDVRTTQNVTITYELAHVRDRILAFLIDYIIVNAIYWLLAWILIVLTSLTDTLELLVVYLIIIPVFIFYTLATESIFNGQTPGKMAMKIKVIKLDGRQPGFYDYLNRWVLRIVDIWGTIGVVGTILISSSDFAQRLGDITTNTTVVKVSNRSIISLKDILKIETRQNYEPQYRAISNFREEDILLIKQTLERYHKYRNNAHKQAVINLCEVLRIKLEIEQPVIEHIKFLKTLIKDYIVLTR